MAHALIGTVLAALIAAGCGSGSTPVSPSPIPTAPASLSGAWTGTLALTNSEGRRITAATSASLTHSGAHLSGTFSTNNDVTGSIDGTIGADGALTGTLSLITAATDGVTRCNGSAASTGTTSAVPLVLRAAAITAPNCTGTLSDLVLTLYR